MMNFVFSFSVGVSTTGAQHPERMSTEIRTIEIRDFI